MEERWILYALMRDNIQHHLEQGEPSQAFDAVHRVGGVLGGQSVRLNARQLRTELEKAHAGLAGRAISELAVSARTRAVIERTWPIQSQPSTVLVDDSLATLIPWLSPGMRSLDHVFGNLIRSLLDVTSGAGPDDVVDVYDL